MTQKEILRSPQNDFLFKKIFVKKENREMLKELLEEILEIKINKINAIQEMTMDRMLKKDKSSRIDIQAEVNDDTLINIEMQIRNEGNIEKRSLFSGAALYHTSLEAGQDYTENKLSVVICILSFNLYDDEDYIVSSRLRTDKTYREVTDGIRVFFIQLPKFIEQKDTHRKKLAEWLYFISQEDKEGLQMAIKENKKVAEAQKQLQELLKDKDVKLSLLAWEKAEFSRQTAMTYARETGRQEGREQGEKAGNKAGREQEKKELAKKMLAKGMSIEDVAEITGLSKKELEKM